MIGRQLYHAVIILRAEIHKIIVDGIHHTPFDVNLVMQVRPGALARIAHGAYHFATHYLTPHFGMIVTEMGVYGLIAKAVVDDNRLAITGLPAYLYHRAIARGIDIGADGSREVHARMKLGRAINGVYTCAVSGSRFLQVLVGNRLNSGDTTEHLVVVLAHFHHFIKRIGLDVKLLPDFIIASPKSEIQPVIGIDEVGYSPLLLGNAEGSFYNVVILRACNLNSNYRLGYPQSLIYRVWTSG